MSRRSLKMIVSIVFFISICLVPLIEFKGRLQNTKTWDIENDRKEIQTIVEESESINKQPQNIDQIGNLDIVDIHKIKEFYRENNKTKNRTYWKPVERKDSYNNELQFYSIDNVTISGDVIEITSRYESKEDKKYTSGMVQSTNAYKYGYYEFVIEVSSGKGIFPAIWLLPINGEPLPEIDVFEMIGSEPDKFYGVIHFIENNVQKRDYFVTKVEKKNQYSVALEWTEEFLTWYIDNKKIYTTTQGVPQQYMYIIVNQAIGGNWPGNPDKDTIFPNKFNILSTSIEPVFKKGRD